MNYTTIRRMLSFLLALCLVLGMIPSLGAAARAAKTRGRFFCLGTFLDL